MENEGLISLRAQIDTLDEELVLLLARRFRVTDAVGKLKATEGLSAIDPDREAAQELRLAQLARDHDVGPRVVNRVFRVIVKEVVSRHLSISDRARQPES